MVPRLAPGEQIMFQGHPSWRSILSFYIKGLLVVLVIAFLVGVVTNIANGDTDTGLVVIVAIVGVALVVLAGLIKRITTHYTITTRRLHIQRGIIARDIQETRLERVQNVNYNQSLLERILQVGDVDFDTAAGDDYNFVFAGVADPAEVVERVDRATHAASPTGLGDQPATQATQQQQPPQP
ncbi:MAG: PH domain-containing protein [Actinobacteria bacterium]|nr:MAG: PH domain-containing protein [Actinomycetota bacterium]